MEKIKVHTLSGFMELLPEEQRMFDSIKETIENEYKKFGFCHIDTPVIEEKKVLFAKNGGDTAKEVYSITKGSNDLCLRFDLTVPLAKYVALHYNQLSFPFKRYQISKVFRGERPQNGRFREFYQCDIDIIGNNYLSVANDAEIIFIMYNIFKKLNISNFLIKINNKKLLTGVIEELGLSEKSVEILRLIDKIDKIGLDTFRDEMLNTLSINNKQIDTIIDFISIKGSVSEQISILEKLNHKNELFVEGLKELKEVFEYLSMFTDQSQHFSLDLKIARGLDYYTGTVYETYLEGYESFGSVCSGGRYDNLAECYSNNKMPGVGMSIGLTRLFSQLKANNLLQNAVGELGNIVILPMNENCFGAAFKLSQSIRDLNKIVKIDYDFNAKFKNRLSSHANNKENQFVIIIGEDEMASGKYTVKNLHSFSQSQLSIEEILSIFA